MSRRNSGYFVSHPVKEMLAGWDMVRKKKLPSGKNLLHESMRYSTNEIESYRQCQVKALKRQSRLLLTMPH